MRTSGPSWRGTGRRWLSSRPESPPPSCLPEFHVNGGRRILGLPLIALGALVALTSFLHWQANQRAMRRDQPLPRSPMPLVLSIGIGIVAIIAVVLAATGPK